MFDKKDDDDDKQKEDPIDEDPTAADPQEDDEDPSDDDFKMRTKGAQDLVGEIVKEQVASDQEFSNESTASDSELAPMASTGAEELIDQIISAIDDVEVDGTGNATTPDDRVPTTEATDALISDVISENLHDSTATGTATTDLDAIDTATSQTLGHLRAVFKGGSVDASAFSSFPSTLFERESTQAGTSPPPAPMAADLIPGQW